MSTRFKDRKPYTNGVVKGIAMNPTVHDETRDEAKKECKARDITITIKVKK
jgi:hypothetical protein